MKQKPVKISEQHSETKKQYVKPSLQDLDASETQAGIFFGAEADPNAMS